MEKITSKQNEHVKIWRKLSTRKGRVAANAYLLEGWHLVNEAVKANAPIETILVVEAEDATQFIDNYTVIQITPEIEKAIASTVTPQGVFAIVSLPNQTQVKPDQVSGAWLLLDDVQDPGNIGTMVRTADAAGFTGVVFGGQTSSQFNPKVLRSMQGSQFHVQITAVADLGDWIAGFKQRSIPVYGTELNPDAKSFREIPAINDVALIMGNEGNGMQRKFLDETTQNLYIPILGRAESLNVAVAAGIIMFSIHY